MLESAQWNNKGHSNRIFSVRFIDDNTIISGGWDSVLHLWDIRQGKSIKTAYGPHVAGDSIDISKDHSDILVGSYATKDQIQLWDYKQFQVRESINWFEGKTNDKPAYVYTCAYRY